MAKVVEIRTEPAYLQYSAASGGLLRKLQHDLELPALSLWCLRQ